MSFIKYLKEQNYEILYKSILTKLEDLSPEELDYLGYVLYDQFLDLSEDEDFEEEFTYEDALEIINVIYKDSPEALEFIDELLDFEDDCEDDLEEGASRRMKTTAFNKKKRKFMGNSKADLRKTKTDRKRSNRANKQKRKRYYKANKQKISKYQKSRANAIKKGKHTVKKRRQS